MTDIYFRTDGNSEIATGHLVRCLAVARACAQKGADIKFIVSDRESLSLLEERFAAPEEFAVFCLERSYQDLPGEIPALLSCLSADLPGENGGNDSTGGGNAPGRKPWLFVDSYFADASYFKALRQYFRTAYLDDLRCLDCAVDLVVNYDTEEDCAAYANAARKLLGMQYTPLREQFRAPSYEVRRKAEHVLLSTGGTDPYRVAESLLRIIFPDPDARTCALPTVGRPAPGHLDADSLPDLSLLQSMHYHILTGRTNTRYAALAALARAYPTIHIHTNVADVAALMASCDLAVSAGGTTLCELCAVGVPTISYLMAENQRIAVEAYAGKHLIPCAGDIRPQACILPTRGPADPAKVSLPDKVISSPDKCEENTNTAVLHQIAAFLLNMAQSYPARAAASAAMRSCLDGTGAWQIAETLMAS